MSFAEMSWPGTVGSLRTTSDATASVIAVITGQDGTAICGQQCDQVPIDLARGSMLVHAQVVPVLDGPVIPIAALGTGADGSTFVLDAHGQRVTVEVRGTDGTRAVVDGVQPGDTIRLFATEGPLAGGSEPHESPTDAPASATP